MFNMLNLDSVERKLVCAVIDAIHDYEMERKFMTLKSGTIIHVCGIPVELSRDAEVMTFPSNEKLIADALAERRAQSNKAPQSGEAQAVPK